MAKATESNWVKVEIRNAAHDEDPKLPPVCMSLDLSNELHVERLAYLKKLVRREDLSSVKVLDDADEVAEEVTAPVVTEEVDEPKKKAPAKKAAAKKS